MRAWRNRQREGDDKENTKEIYCKCNKIAWVIKRTLIIIFVYRLLGFFHIDLGKCNTVGCVHLHVCNGLILLFQV